MKIVKELEHIPHKVREAMVEFTVDSYKDKITLMEYFGKHVICYSEQYTAISQSIFTTKYKNIRGID